jgi:hypothetical protein
MNDGRSAAAISLRFSASTPLTLAAFVYVPPICHILGQHPLTAAQWLPVLVTPFVLLAAEEARKALVRRRPTSP